LESASVLIFHALAPEKPDAPTTTIVGDNVVTSWVAPSENGSAILSYQITFLTSDGVTFLSEMTDCDGSDSTIVQSQSCSIPTIKFYQAPYSLAWGSSVYAKVIATNLIGDSLESEQGNGAIIVS
jgi:hypothetical protein